MITIPENILKKHAVGIQAAMNYYVNNQPTGLSDEDYDALEKMAREDGLELRDYVCQGIQGKRSQNADYITKVEKVQVSGIMGEAMESLNAHESSVAWWLPKYDGSSLAAYYDSWTGKCIRVVTVGGSNLGGMGIDQTEKFLRFFPDLPGTGICGLQCECLVSLEKGLGEKSRQKANGLVNSSYQPLSRSEFKAGKGGSDPEYSKYLQDFQENNMKVKAEIDDLITLRCFRYFVDPEHPASPETLRAGQKAVLEGLPRVYNSAGDIKFAGAFVFDHPGDFVETDIWNTPDGTFLVDGVVGYTFDGRCVLALKYKDAGRGESTEVLRIQWNDQSKKGKDSWSANAIINPITVRGTQIRKPTVGSVRKMIDTGLSPGARVTVIMANSTIPQISKVISPGNLDFSWPTCECGWTLGPSDIYGALAKCGNPKCAKRETRMRKYLGGLGGWTEIDLNKLLILDRWDWGKKLDTGILLGYLWELLMKGTYEDFRDYMVSLLPTPLLRSNMELVSWPAYVTLKEYADSLRTI